MATAEDYSREVESVHSGNLEVRLARDLEEIDAAQSLRYRVFYEEMSANPSSKMKALKRDFDKFDNFWDHLLVLDNSKTDIEDKVIGTYRLNRKSIAQNLIFDLSNFSMYHHCNKKVYKTVKKLLSGMQTYIELITPKR